MCEPTSLVPALPTVCGFSVVLVCVVVVYPTLSPTVCGCASVCGVWGDPPTAPSGGDSCHQFTEGDTPSSLLYCSHHLEGVGSVDRRGQEVGWYIRTK